MRSLPVLASSNFWPVLIPVPDLWLPGAQTTGSKFCFIIINFLGVTGIENQNQPQHLPYPGLCSEFL